MYWRGKRRKTAEYTAYQNEIRDEIMGIEWPFGDNQLNVITAISYSNRAADLDNAVKPLFDTLQAVFEDFNDNKVYLHLNSKHIVPKGEENIEISITAREEKR